MAFMSSLARGRFGVAALASGLLAAAAAASPASALANGQSLNQPRTQPIAPVIDSNFADPDILQVGGVYHAYATNSGGQNIQHEVSTDLTHWTTEPDVLPALGSWVGPCSFAPGGATDHCVWAPEVTAVPGGFNLYYTARDKLASYQCIGLAFSTSPNGPFVPVGTEPLVCPDGARGTAFLGGAIDAATYSENGQLYLLWKSDGNCCQLPATINIQTVSADGRTLTSPPTELIRNDRRFEGAVVEAPTLMKHDGRYYLFYSANDFGGGNYRTGWASASRITGPYTKSTTELMTTDLFHGTVIGPGGEDVVTNPDGTSFLAFHGWDPSYSYRAMYVSTLSWSGAGVPQVEAADRRYQAEDGALTDARAVPDDSASGEAKVGGMDNPDSSVTVRLYADKSGPETLGVRYANGSRDASGNGVAATDALAVNGSSVGTVTLPNTAWGNWQMVEVGLSLVKGWNTVTLTKLTWYSEIDALDLYSSHLDQTPKGPPADTSSGVRYEAENGVVTDARVVADPTASGGAKVGYLDNPDSSVTLTVTADAAGPATLAVRYDNGSLDRSGYPVSATDRVTVDGSDAGVMTFRNTTWGNWQTATDRVLLHKGANTVTFTKVTFYTELDAVDVS
ncbi:MAG: hypothetical protein QOI76_4088 [Frankiales bacterium]|jgi:GH43 family beta-xylosidase|nr:hypothetical protein [Frankiales bacterium]